MSLNFRPRRRASTARRRVWIFRHGESGREIAVPEGLGEPLYIMVSGWAIARNGGRTRKVAELAALGIHVEPGEGNGAMIRLPDGHGWSFVDIRPC